jgi:hypothetical protein
MKELSESKKGRGNKIRRKVGIHHLHTVDQGQATYNFSVLLKTCSRSPAVCELIVTASHGEQ